MIGLTILVVIALYVWLARTVIKKVYSKTQSLTKKRIAIAIFILIPTWDIILGFPIYAYLCMTQSGVKIYKTVNNVEGFYVGEQDGTSVIEPYEGYQFIEYKEKNSGKYYRSYWLDNNTSELCAPVGIYRYSPYAEAFAKGKCIAKKEIKVSEVSKWDASLENAQTTNLSIPWLSIGVIQYAHIKNSITNETLAEDYSVYFNGIWILGYITSISTGHPRLFYCGSRNDIFTIYYLTLKPKNGEK